MVAAFLKTESACRPSDWVFDGLPCAGDPRVVDYFFLSVKHQYGFWHDDGDAYIGPMYGTVEGRRFKGSDFVWHAIRRSASGDPGLYDLKRQAGMSDGEISAVFADDTGACPLPMLDTHCALWRQYAKDLLQSNLTPAGIVQTCKTSDDPVQAMMTVLATLGGYKEDPLAKKAALLALILANRPERFLSGRDLPLRVAPIVDYHVMRSLIRIGLIRIDDPGLEQRIRQRKILAEQEASEIRRVAYDAMLLLEESSGKGIDALDWFFFQNRRRCPEMTDPDCPHCEIQSVCAKRKELFQPVIRTTFY